MSLDSCRVRVVIVLGTHHPQRYKTLIANEFMGRRYCTKCMGGDFLCDELTMDCGILICRPLHHVDTKRPFPGATHFLHLIQVSP